jgi:hypothetical protein
MGLVGWRVDWQQTQLTKALMDVVISYAVNKIDLLSFLSFVTPPPPKYLVINIPASFAAVVESYILD